MKNLLIVSHCILNNAAKVEQDEAELAEEYKIREELMQLILKKDVQLLQLPCPEFIMYGSQRWGHVKNQFQHPFYMEQCRKILEPVLLQLQEYAQHVEKFHVLGIVSVEGSPNCGYHLTCEGEWKGEIGTDEKRIQDIQKSLKMTENPGVYMEVLEKELQKKYGNSYCDDERSSATAEQLKVREKRGEQNEKQKSLCNNFLRCCSSNEHRAWNYHIGTWNPVISGYTGNCAFRSNSWSGTGNHCRSIE